MPLDWITDDGYDMTFGTNVVGKFFPPEYLSCHISQKLWQGLSY